MKVLVATDFPHNPQKPSGGVEAVSVNLVSALAQMPDVEVHVVTVDPKISSPVEFNYENAQGLRLKKTPGSTLRSSLGQGARLIAQHAARIRPDIVHAHDTYGLMTGRLNCPHIFTVHGFIHGDILVSSVKFRRVRSAIWKYFETRGWSQQPAIISISPYVREYVSRFSNARIFDVDNPVSEDLFEIMRTPIPGRVFSAAVISRRKNTFALIKAIHKIVNSGVPIKGVFAGHVTEPSYFEEIVKYVDTNNLHEFVKFLGMISQSQIQKELTKASVFALTSREENSPMSIEEAMAVGVPVVTSNRCGMPYMVRHNETGFLVDPENSTEISEAIQRIGNDASLAEKMSENAVRVARERFHPKAVAERTKIAYQEVIRSSNRT